MVTLSLYGMRVEQMQISSETEAMVLAGAGLVLPDVVLVTWKWRR